MIRYQTCHLQINVQNVLKSTEEPNQCDILGELQFSLVLSF